MASFTWSYDGGANLGFVATGLVANGWYEVRCDSSLLSFDTVQASGAGGLSYTFNDIYSPDDPTNGNPGTRLFYIEFVVDHVVSNVDNTLLGYAGCNVFLYGQATSVGVAYNATWTYTNATPFAECDFATTIDGFPYQLQTNSHQGGGGGSWVSATGASITGDGTIKTRTSTFSGNPNDADTGLLRVFASDPLSSDPSIDYVVTNRLFSPPADGVTPGNPEPPPGPASADQGIRVAFTSDAYDTGPVWVRIDDPTYPAVPTNSNSVVSWESHRGRQYELDKTQAGTAVINIVDSTGRFDPSNPSGPYYGNIKPLKQVKINVQNPVDGSYHDIFTGFSESWDYTFPDQSATVMEVTLNCTDGFEPLTRAEVVPDSSGTTTYAAQQVDDRIKAALADAGWPAGMTNIFTGNVDMIQTIYNPQTAILAVIQDAADAEFPNAANVFMDRWGRVAFRGRWARFNPATYEGRDVNSNPPLGSKQIIVWNVGDRNAAQTFGIAPIAEIEWTLDLKNIINACLCMPYNIAQGSIAGQLKTDPTSISEFGVRALSIPDLLIDKSIAGPGSAPPGGDGVGKPSADANDECKIIGQYFVDNYAQPVEMISSIQFQTISPTDTLGAPWWKFVTGVEIGDIVVVTQTNPGGGGFKATQFFVEGIHNVVTLGSGTYPQWTMNLDLTPRSWYAKFDGVTYFTP